MAAGPQVQRAYLTLLEEVTLAPPRGSRSVLAALTCFAVLATIATHAGDKDGFVEALRRIANPPLGLPRLTLTKQDEPDAERIALRFLKARRQPSVCGL